MKYLSVAEARVLPGLRLVLTAHMPGPWGEAAKAVLSVRHVQFVPVAQAAMEVNDDLYAWTGVRNHSAKLHLMAMKKGERAFFYHSNE